MDFAGALAHIARIVRENSNDARRICRGLTTSDKGDFRELSKKLDRAIDWLVFQSQLLSTELADLFRGSLGDAPDDLLLIERRAVCYPTLPVLELLNGKPWNNAALCVVLALRPSFIRVTQGEIKTDSRAWRVTVWLEGDGRTIRSIDQEVVAPSIGGGCSGRELLRAASSG